MAVQLAVQGPCTITGPFLLPKRRQECILTVCAVCTKAEDLSLCLPKPGAEFKTEFPQEQRASGPLLQEHGPALTAPVWPLNLPSVLCGGGNGLCCSEVPENRWKCGTRQGIKLMLP